MIRVSIDRPNERDVIVSIEQTSREVDVSMRAALRRAGVYVTTVIKKDVLSGQILKRRSGNLSRSIFVTMESPTKAVVGVGKEAPYAAALNNGARPHIIEAKPGKTLAFVPGGVAHAIQTSGFIKTARGRRSAMRRNTIYRQRVMHPGNPPFRFIEIGLKMATPGVRGILAEGLAKALKKKGRK